MGASEMERGDGGDEICNSLFCSLTLWIPSLMQGNKLMPDQVLSGSQRRRHRERVIQGIHNLIARPDAIALRAADEAELRHLEPDRATPIPAVTAAGGAFGHVDERGSRAMGPLGPVGEDRVACFDGAGEARTEDVGVVAA